MRRFMGLDIMQIGAVAAVFPFAYGLSKFFSGLLGSRTSPRALLVVGLAGAALANIAFGLGNSMLWFYAFWALNGIVQAREPNPFIHSLYQFLTHCSGN